MVKRLLAVVLLIQCISPLPAESDESELISLSLRELMHIPLRVDRQRNRIFQDKSNPIIDNSVIFGLLAPISAYPEYGSQLVAAADLAAFKINQWGGINGKKLIILRGDDEENTPISAQLAKQMVSEFKAQALIGPATSNSVADIVDKVVNPLKIPLISQAATSNGLLERAGYQNLWLLPSSNNHHTEFIVDYLYRKKGHKKIFVLANRTLFSEEIIAGIRALAATNSDLQVDAMQISEMVYLPGMDLKNEIHNIQSQGFSAIILTLNNDQMLPMIEKISRHWRGKYPLLLGADTMKPNDLAAAEFGDIEHCTVTYMSLGDRQNEALNKQIQSLLDIGHVGYDAAYVFDATVILAMAKKLQLAFKLTMDDAVEAIAGNGHPITVDDYPRIERLYRKYGQLRFNGYSGRIQFNEQGENIASRLQIIELSTPAKREQYCLR